MSSFRPGRLIGIVVGTVVILGVGVYGPATLLGPLPVVTATRVTPPASVTSPTPPTLSTNGASAIAVRAAADTTGAAARFEPLAAAGSAAPLPMASIAKVVTALVVLDAKPIVAGESGPIITVSAADFQRYLDYDRVGARTVTVFADEKWTELEMLQALLLGSSNNHADSIAIWAFGSLDSYVVAANAWLNAQGLVGTTIIDATGLSSATAGTASDLARLAGLASADPVVSDVLQSPASALADRRGVENTTAYRPEDGIVGVSRSYTDAAGVCFIFTATLSDGASTFEFAGAFLGEPTYDALGADLTALMASAQSGVGDWPIVTANDVYATFDSAWGEQGSAVVGATRSRFGWQNSSPAPTTVTLERFSTARTGARVGQVELTVAGETISAALKLQGGITGPGLGWRLLHPVAMVQAWLDQ